MTSQCRGQKKVVEALLKHGAAPSLDEANGFPYGSVLAATCSYYDQDHDTVRLLMKAGARPERSRRCCTAASQVPPEGLGRLQPSSASSTWAASTECCRRSPSAGSRRPRTSRRSAATWPLVKVLAEHEKFRRSRPTKRTRRAGRRSRSSSAMRRRPRSRTSSGRPAVATPRRPGQHRPRTAVGRAC